jgi:hypothetical protein
VNGTKVVEAGLHKLQRRQNFSDFRSGEEAQNAIANFSLTLVVETRHPVNNR